MSKAAYAGALAAVALIAYLSVPVSVLAQHGRSMTMLANRSGKVMMEDGSPPPEPVDVDKFCTYSGSVPVAKTDSKGDFVVGSGMRIGSDIRYHQGNGNPDPGPNPLDLAGCTLQARLPGYESSKLRIGSDDSLYLGVIILSRRSGVEGNMFSGTALSAPEDARRNFDRARQSIEKKKLAQAKPLLEKAVKGYPGYAAAWFELGRIHQAARDLPQARKAFQQAIKADPKYTPPYLHLAAVHNSESNWKGTADVTAALLKLNPYDYPAAYAFHAVSNLRLGNDAAAETSSRKILEMGGERAFPEAEYVLGVIMGARGDTRGGAEHLTSFLRLAPNSPSAGSVRRQLAEWGQPAPPK